MKVIIIDDHPLVRSGLSTILSLNDSFECLGEASDIITSLQLIRQTNPDVALVDLKLGNEDGLDLIGKARDLGIQCKFIVLTSSANQEDIHRAKESNVDGYILKEALPEELFHAMQIVIQGRKYYDPNIFELMLTDHDTDHTFDDLTPKELEVLKELGKGLSNQEIASKLFVTEYTVKKHVSQVLAKLELSDRTNAALYANSKGLVTYAVH
ncbi:response regulator [Chengkuizengella axinellae]|uniref:Response regulator transcription factor n=1 Tax=Chengkuizengella axinellae TaxID=3064388 RepID=A0ABT9IYF1_9BACL|nr:response regulator transcription factor [Chengkuizengella sp. 2205SS18-9]MDP5274387.1 response regulator transcription factor [Chengkuizengella sp. 2205SS18-9]